MNKEEKIKLAHKNLLRASKEIGFKAISPYSIEVGNSRIEVFAFLPDYGSLNGAVVDLTSDPNFETNGVLSSWAKKNGIFISFLNLQRIINYDEGYFREILDDWRMC